MIVTPLVFSHQRFPLPFQNGCSPFSLFQAREQPTGEKNLFRPVLRLMTSSLPLYPLAFATFHGPWLRLHSSEESSII